MKRVKPLRSDPDKVREWQARSRQRARENVENRRQTPRAAATRRPRRKRDNQVGLDPEVRTTALARSGGFCIRPGCERLATHPHHVLPKQAAYFPELTNEPDMIVGLCFECHQNHHYGARPEHRLPRSALPQCALAFASRDQRMQYWLERLYPERKEST